MTTTEPRSTPGNGLGKPSATVLLPPDPRINEALGLQHRLETAIADLVDNSIDAAAAQVWVRFIVEDAYVREILVLDNGRGMSRDGIRNAFVLGGAQEYDENRLGHYGVGMKASAYSQAELLTVVSRSAGENAVAMTARRSAGDNLTADVYSTRDAEAALGAADVPLSIENGTLLRLTKIRTASASDRIDVRQQWIDDRITRLRNHLGLIFHRFLSDGRLNITIDVWDNIARESGVPFHPSPLDPFGVSSGKTGYPRSMIADLPGGVAISMTCSLLAPGVKNRESHIFGAPRTDWQGLYVYRNDRLLNPGGWGDVDRGGSDRQLARVAIDVTPATEKWFGMNAGKNGVLLLPDLVHAIQNAGDEDVSFRDYLGDARDVLKQSNRRQRAIKPLTPMGAGMPHAVEGLAAESIGFREFERSVNVRWKSLRPERVFLIDHERATIWLNERHRGLLANGDSDDPHGLVKTLLFLLFETYFPQAHLQQTTIDQIEAWQGMVAVALGVKDFIAAEEVAVADGDDEAAVDEIENGVLPQVGANIAKREEARTDGIWETDQNDGEAEQSPGSVEILPDDNGIENHEDEEDEDESGDDEGEAARKSKLTGEWSSDSMREYLAIIGRHDLLNAEEEVELAQRIEAGIFAEERLEPMSEKEKRSAAGRDLLWVARNGRRASDKLISSNLRLVVSIARRYQKRGLELLDLIQEGNAGLVHAAEMFDYTRGLKFSTYATWWIRQAVTRAIADKGSAIRLPVHMGEFGNHVKSARAELEAELGRVPSNAEIAERMDVDEKKIELFLRMSKPVYSLNKIFAGGDWSEPEDMVSDEYGAPTIEATEFGDTLLDDIDPIEEALVAMMVQTQIDTVLSMLDDRAAGVIIRRFGLGGEDAMTLDAIGEVYGVTRERIRQIEQKAFKTLREPQVLRRLAGEIGAGNDVQTNTRARSEAVFDALAPDAAIEIESLIQPDAEVKVARSDGPLAEDLARLMDSFEALVPDDEETLESPDELERAWRSAELRQLLQTYRDTRHVRNTAQISIVDERDAAIALTRLLLWNDGPIDDFVNAPNHGAHWAPEDSSRIVEDFAAGIDLQGLARAYGRTQLAIGWRLLDSTAHPVDIPHRLFDEARLERYWGNIRNKVSAWNQTFTAR